MDYKTYDPDLWNAIAREEERQENNLELIASENVVSKAVMAAQGSILTNKYAEGYPGKRYYGGCEFIDIVENLAIDRAKELFGAKFANVQAHSGSQANTAAYLSLVEPGDTILGMDLSAGGHLTHGSPVNFSGKTYNFVSYGVDPSTEVIDYDVDAKLMVDMAHIAGLVASGLHPNPVPYADIVTSTTHKTLRGPRGGLILTNSEELAKKVNSSIFPGIQGGPLEHVIAGKAAAFKEALDPSFAEYSQQVIANAQAMTKVFNQAPEARLISGATDNHLLLIEVTGFGLNGKEAEAILDSVNITVNKNSIPFEQLSPFKTSGIRIGTPAITSRGFKEEDAVEVAKLIVQVLKDPENTAVHDEVKAAVAALTKKYPLYN